METDRDAIISDDLLNDRHINYAQTLLHHQFPLTEGLYNTVTLAKEEPAAKDQMLHSDYTVQITHNLNGTHVCAAWAKAKNVCGIKPCM